MNMSDVMVTIATVLFFVIPVVMGKAMYKDDAPMPTLPMWDTYTPTNTHTEGMR